MTTIVAVNTPEDQAVYADSLAQHGSIAIPGWPKVFHIPGVLVGAYTGSVSDSLRVIAALEDLCDAGNLHRFFARRGRQEPVKVSESGQRDLELLVLYDHRLWLLWEDLVPLCLPVPFFAKGSGGQFAMGALAAGASPWRAFAIASQYDVGTGPPFVRLDTEGKRTHKPDGVEENDDAGA